MTESVSHLYRVHVEIPGGRSWSVLVRAVDEESAAGAVRARGNNVTGVNLADKPRSDPTPPRTTCLNCEYPLRNLPVGDAGEVQCPECGVINAPLPEGDSLWDEVKATRREFVKFRRERGLGGPAFPTIGFSILILIVIGAITALLRWLGWIR